ncbi:hypothetical protein [Flavobacterium sp. NRK1]|uniref:hypothetical protein n=1 Tax=Flavobacterium sp. NRK1 TaxID=2954929 RepID=UPI0020931DE6|nr:hypothetical protein [Flavobacterium sp. NRK1]MCO6148681.1 hypothetical protein [Flavobacterium sp. NRK1]
MEYPLFLQYRISQLLRLPVWFFGISFTLGTIMAALDIYTSIDILFAIGFLYVIIAGFINASMFGTLVICSFIFKEYQRNFLQNAAILLINIPVLILYLIYYFQLYSFI